MKRRVGVLFSLACVVIAVFQVQKCKGTFESFCWWPSFKSAYIVRVQFWEGEQRLGLFNVYAPFLADLNLLFQVAILLVLLASLRFKFRRSYLRHGISMGLAVVLHTVSIFVVMVPSLLASGGLFGDLLNRLALVVFSHAVLGSFVEVLGLYLLSVLALHRGVSKACFRNKMIMRVTLVLWVVELVVGVYVYFLLYTFGQSALDCEKQVREVARAKIVLDEEAIFAVKRT